MRVLTDADAVVYGAGFAAQKTVDGVVVAEPLAHALTLAKTSLQAIWEEINAWLAQSGERVDALEVYLTGSTNFRHEIATLREYKGHRKNKPRPVHYAAIRQYMIDHWGAKVIEGREADDELAIVANSLDYDPDRVLIASIDKDLKTVPGLLYSFRKKESYLIEPKEALANEHRQCIVGDTADAIPGAFRCGEKRAKAVTEDMTPKQMWDEVLLAFQESTKRKGCPYSDAESAALETMRLVHLQRYPNEMWEPPTC